MPLESDASAELGEAEITVPSAESFGSQQAVGPGTDDTQGLSDRRPMQATKQADTLALLYNPPPPSTHSNTPTIQPYFGSINFLQEIFCKTLVFVKLLYYIIVVNCFQT